VANPPELGAKLRLGYTASLLDRMAQRRDDALAIKKLCEHARAGVYVIGGELVVLKGTGEAGEMCNPLFSPTEASARSAVPRSASRRPTWRLLYW